MKQRPSRVGEHLGTKHGGLGRLPSRDDRDANYPMRALAAPEPPAGYKYWYDSGWWGDQGSTPQCVAYSALHRVEDSPRTHPESTGSTPVVVPAALYGEAQVLDEWPGSDYDGSSVRGGAEALRQRGLIQHYHWAVEYGAYSGIDELIRAVLTLGPAVVGTDWYYSMFRMTSKRDALGDLKWMLVADETSGVAGGHAWIVNGVNVPRRTFRMKNSWGRFWGIDGRATVSFEDMEQLMSNGEAAIYTEAA